MASGEKKIIIRPNGPYKVYGNIPLVHKTQIVSEYGEPLTWRKDETIETPEEYDLCRCGRSEDMPFCDSTHRNFDFDGTETADTRLSVERQVVLKSGKRITIKRDASLCSESGFCGTRFANFDQLAARTGDTQVRSLVIAMIERCPSGSLAYSIGDDPNDVEPDLPQEIAVTTEILAEGPVAGPLWVTGGIPIERADGQPFETRNRVALCSCGRSANKPLCDGTHRIPGEQHSHSH